MFDAWSRAPKPVMDAADVEAVLAEAIELGSANLTYVWEDSAPEEKALMAGVAAAMRHGTGPVIIDTPWMRGTRLGVRLPEREVARALRSLTSREVLAGDQAYRFNVDLQRLWCEKHRHLDWVKDELAEAIQQWTGPPNLGPRTRSPSRLADGRRPAWRPAAGNPETIRRGKARSSPEPLSRHRSCRCGPGQLSNGCRSRTRVPLLQFDAGSHSRAKPRSTAAATAGRPTAE